MNKYTADCTCVADAIAFIESVLSNSSLTKRNFHQTLLISEEIAVKIQEIEDVSKFKVTIAKNLGEFTVRMTFSSPRPFELNDEDEEIGGRILHYYGEKIKFRYRNGINTVTILAGQTFTQYFHLSALAFAASIIFCGIMFLSVSQENRIIVLQEFILPIEHIFAKAVCLLATPVTFFCLVSNIAEYSNLIDRYPDTRRLIVRYIATSVAAIGIGYGVFLCLRPLALNYEIMNEYRINSETTLNFSTIWNALESIVPDDIFAPFTKSNILPMLFLALISGISVGIIDRQSGKCKELVDVIRDFFCKMLYIVFDFGAIMVFFCFSDAILYEGWHVLPYILYLLLALLVVLMVLNLYYMVDLVIHRISPEKTYETMKRCFWETFLIGSSVDAIPNTLRHCIDKLELPRKPLEISIPLGANMNMDGNCAVLMILIPIIGIINGIELTLAEVIIMGVTILMLSLGAPNQPGSLTVATMILLPQLGLAEEMITVTLIMEILTCRILAASNVLGDIVTSTIVGEQERRRVKKQRQSMS